ncbi:phage tail sheath family protein [Clostridiaceae bacterium M8S5]|nr:phage tail sheath family protein [Clostridiaceae bacterium M8S5]
MSRTWESQNKVRPGVYINTFASKQSQLANPERGVVSLPLELNWGKEREMIEITSADVNNLFDRLGYNITDDELILIKETLKRSKTLLLYRVNSGEKATKKYGANLTATAVYGGTRGNDIAVEVLTDVDNSGKFIVKTYIDTKLVDEQNAGKVEELKANKFVTFSGTGALAAATLTKLSGGTNTAVVAENYSSFLVEVEKRAREINTIGYIGVDSAIKALFKVFIKRMREEEQCKMQAVLENYPEADYEGIISIKNGVIISGGRQVSASECVAYVAGATAGANVNESLTYSAYDGAIDVSTILTGREIADELKKGNVVFVRDGNLVKIEQDINTLTTFTDEKAKTFRKNRVVRVLDGFNRDVKRIYNDFFIGKVDNDESGRNALRNEILKLAKFYESIGAIQNFSSEDIKVKKGTDKDSAVVVSAIQPTDSVEKIYINVEVL